MYFDPGMGSLVIQMIIAVLAVVGGYFAVAKTKLKDIFRKKSDNSEANAKNGEDADDTL